MIDDTKIFYFEIKSGRNKLNKDFNIIPFHIFNESIWFSVGFSPHFWIRIAHDGRQWMVSSFKITSSFVHIRTSFVETYKFVFQIEMKREGDEGGLSSVLFPLSVFFVCYRSFKKDKKKTSTSLSHWVCKIKHWKN